MWARPRSRTSAEERGFGLTVGTALAVLAALRFWRHGSSWLVWTLVVTGGLLALVGLAAPRFLTGARRAWLALGERLAGVGNFLLLSVVFFVVLTPLSWLQRLRGADPLDRRSPRRASYWRPIAADRRDAKHFERMY